MLKIKHNRYYNLFLKLFSNLKFIYDLEIWGTKSYRQMSKEEASEWKSHFVSL